MQSALLIFKVGIEHNGQEMVHGCSGDGLGHTRSVESMMVSLFKDLGSGGGVSGGKFCEQRIYFGQLSSVVVFIGVSSG